VPKTLLLADDSQTIRRVVELTFAEGDVRVISVADGNQAVEAVERACPDIVVADIDMPGLNGYDVAAYIRHSGRHPHLPVILLAGAFDHIDHDRVRAVAADAVLTKPFEPALIVGRVHELLDGRREAIAAPVASSALPETVIMRRPAVLEPAAPVHAEAPDTSEVPPAPIEPAPAPERDRYFEQIDEAFAALARTPRKFPPELPAEEPLIDDEEALPALGGPAHPAQHDGAGADLHAPAVTHAPALGHALLPDAFAALLAAERSGVPIVPPPAAPAPAPPPAPAPAIDIDRLAEEISRRVLAQLTDAVVRDTVASIVNATAERLVTQEIERIKREIR
jgi:CheY-like chemotaxis protein